MKTITIKRVYDNKSADGSYRILVDRLWPRGIRKIDLQIEEWNKEVAPSVALRKWFDDKKERFEEFSKLYIHELMAKTDEVNRLKIIAKTEDITLLYAAKDPEINHAIILKDYLSN
ncbi:hypothetical protein D3C80_1532850 [compost metagenome]